MYKTVTLLKSICHDLLFRPMLQYVYFHGFLRETTCPRTYALVLFCYPRFKIDEVEGKMSTYDNHYIGEGRSKEPLCVGDEIMVSLTGFDFVQESQRNEKVVLR